MYPPPGPPGWPPQGPQPPQGWQQPPQGYPPQSFVPPPPMQIPAGCTMCGVCRYVGIPRQSTVGGPSGCLAIVLLFCGIVPGVLYLLFASGDTVYNCQNCGNSTGPGQGGSSGTSGCAIIMGIFLALVLLGGIAQVFIGAAAR